MKKNITYTIYRTITNENGEEIEELPTISSGYLLDIINYLKDIIKIDGKHISKYVNKENRIIINKNEFLKVYKFID